MRGVGKVKAPWMGDGGGEGNGGRRKRMRR